MSDHETLTALLGEFRDAHGDDHTTRFMAEWLARRGVRVSVPAAPPSEALTRSRIDHWLRNRRLRLRADFDAQSLGTGETVDILMALLEDLGEYTAERAVDGLGPPDGPWCIVESNLLTGGKLWWVHAVARWLLDFPHDAECFSLFSAEPGPCSCDREQRIAARVAAAIHAGLDAAAWGDSQDGQWQAVLRALSPQEPKK